ncbi:MAG: 30S ribosomal protein S17 [Pyrinomonadaceae bacterium]
MPRKKKDEEIVGEVAETSVDETAVKAASEEIAEVAAPNADEVAVETVAVAKEKPKKVAKEPKAKADKVADAGPDEIKKIHKRAEKIGIVASDKMMKTVTVRVDRLVKHPIYRKYVRKRKKFMAHDDMGAKIGDKVKIVETRPLSARKRWRVVEIIQKAEL